MDRQLRVVHATLTVRVPVNATGSLADGAARIVERIDAVDGVDEPEVRGLQPGLNDTAVDLHVRVTVVGEHGEDVALVRRELRTGVGVLDVDRVEAVDPEASLEEVTARAG